MGKRKKIIIEIAMMEKLLRYQKIKLLGHKRYLASIVSDHRIVLLAAMLPLFLWGWDKGSENSLGKIVRKLVKVAAISMRYYTIALKHFAPIVNTYMLSG